MPSTYAHYRFGQEVFQKLPADIQKKITPCMDLFNVGLHGPDLLFYYKPLSSNAVNRIGYGDHKKSGREFFEPAGRVLAKKQFADAHFAYLCGFLCHFALDRECHGYIGEQIKETGISHAEIEVEFDRSLLAKDGHAGSSPVRQILTGHIHPTKESAKVIHDFFLQTTEEQIFKCLKSMIFYCNLFVAPGKIKRSVLLNGMRLAGIYKEMHGQIMNYEPNPACKESCKRLNAMYEKAVGDAVTLIRELRENVNGELPWSGLYHYTFDSDYRGGAQ